MNPASYQTYTVRPGDTLTSIASRAGFENPMALYQDPANAALRRLRPSPNHIRPGDQILIPPSPAALRQTLQKRLSALTTLRQQSDSLYVQIESELDANIRKYRTVSERVDVAATIANIGVSLGQITIKGFAAMKLSGAALEEANHELAKDTLKFAYEPLRDPALKAGADALGAHPGTVTLFGKSAIEAFLNIQSPSFWAGVWGNWRSGMSWSQAVTTDPVQTMIDRRNRVEAQRQQTLRSVDQKIQQTQQLLQSLPGSNGPVTKILL